MKQTPNTLLVLAVAMAFASSLYSQRDKYEYADRDGVWAVSTGDQAMSAIRLSPAERATVVEKREPIFNILRATAAFNPLKGVPLRADKTVVATGDAHGQYLMGPINVQVGVTIGHFTLNRRTGQVDPFTIEMPRLEIVTNDIERAALRGKSDSFWYEGLFDDAGIQLFLEPRQIAATGNGRAIYRLDEYVYKVVVTNGRPSWIPVTREHFLRAMMAYVDHRRAGQPPVPEGQSFELQRRRVFEKELAALSASERQAPAYYATNPAQTIEQVMRSGLTDSTAPGARLVVRSNPDYFDPSLPRTAWQLIACEFNFAGPVDLAEAPEHREIAVRTLYRVLMTLEYDKLAALIERPKQAALPGATRITP